MNSDFDKLQRELELRQQLAEIRKYNFLPAAQEMLNEGQRGFCNMQSRFSLMSGGNQQGKSFVGKVKAATHLTGHYPDWWEGPRLFPDNKKMTAFVAGVTGQSTRDLLINGDGAGTIGLLGPEGDRGSGLIPRESIIEIRMARGSAAGQVDWFKVRRADGGEALVLPFAYSLGADRMQGYSPLYGFIDEEPDYKVYDELQARFLQTGGYMDMVFTPLKGATRVFTEFETSQDHDLKDIFFYSIDMATHLSDERKAEMVRQLSAGPQADARLNGRPVLGEGQIFRTDDSEITCDPFEIPPYYKRIIGIDFPHTTGDFAASSLAIDPNTDCWYLVDCYRRGNCERPIYVDAVAHMGGDVIPVAWPHDGGRRDGTSTLAERYREAGLNLLSSPAAQKTRQGSRLRTKDVWIEELAARMANGKFKVFSTCQVFFLEKNQFHQKNGKVVDGNDDVLDALGKAVLAVRHAQPVYSKYPGTKDGGLGDMLNNYDFFKGGWGANGL